MKQAEPFLYTWRNKVASESGPESPITRYVLLAVSLHMDRNGTRCFPSERLLATRTGLSERTVCKHLKLAAAKGWIGRKKCRDYGKSWAQYHYWATLPTASIAPKRQRDGTASHGDLEPNDVPTNRTENYSNNCTGGDPQETTGLEGPGRIAFEKMLNNASGPPTDAKTFK